MNLLNTTTVTVLLLVLMTSSFLEAAEMAPAPAPTVASSGLCNAKCMVRCSKASRHSRCLMYCGICCEKCNYCVPSGTYVNKDECPCYRDMVVSKTGKPKCP